MKIRKTVATALVVVAGATGIAACGTKSDATNGAKSSLPQGSERVNLNPADFTTNITNPYWPMKPGNRWVFEETGPDMTAQHVVVRVTDKTKKLANGVGARVVRDTVTDSKSGALIEDTIDWYAQDQEGNLWYMGESTKEYENGKVKTTKGSWQAGVDGAQPGIALPANPEPSLSYRQEYYAGQAEDKAEVVSVNKDQIEVPAGHYTNVLMTRDLVPLEPKVLEFKFYAKGVGPVSSTGVSGGSHLEELTSFSR